MKRPNLRRRIAVANFVVSILFLTSFPVLAWQNDNEEASAERKQGYPVSVGGYELFRIHETLGAASPQLRAERISATLEDLAKAQDFDPTKFQVNDEGSITTVRYGDQLIVMINDAEARGSGLPRKALAGQYALILQSKLPAVHEQHTPRYLWKAAAYAVITIFIYLVLLWAIIRVTRWVLNNLETRSRGRIQGFKIQESEIIQGSQVGALLASVVRLLRVIVIAVLTYGFLAKAFSFFPWTR